MYRGVSLALGAGKLQGLPALALLPSEYAPTPELPVCPTLPTLVVSLSQNAISVEFLQTLASQRETRRRLPRPPGSEAKQKKLPADSGVQASNCSAPRSVLPPPPPPEALPNLAGKLHSKRVEPGQVARSVRVRKAEAETG